MSLKFREVEWDDRGLMYVAFDNNSETLRWYPKWKDVAAVFDSAFATEDGINHGKLTPYLLFICLNILTRSLLLKADSPEVLHFNWLADQIKAKLLEKTKGTKPKNPCIS